MLRSTFYSPIAYTSCTGHQYTRVNLSLARANASVRASRPGPQQPSLSRGWILEPELDSGGSRVEVLLSAQEEVEDGREQEISDSLRIARMQFQVDGKMKLVPEAKYVRGADIKKASFIRVYYICALRVPAKDSGDLAQSLEEHLLNWPRVDNIARVRGDDVDEDLEDLFSGTEEWRQSNVRTMTICGEDLTTNFESMRTKMISKQKDVSLNGTYDNRKRTSLKYQPYTLEVMHEKTQMERHRGTLGLLQKTWAGPTRLLLLNEEIVGRSPQLPAFVQAVLSGAEDCQEKGGCQLVSCRLTLFYEYWSSKEVLRDLLPPEVMVPDGFEKFGHVAFLTLSAEQLKFRHLIAQVTLDKYQPVVRSVVVKREARHTKPYAVRVEVLAGTSSLVTTLWENAIPFRIDLGSVIWDSRVKADRRRLVELFSKRDVLCDVFAGPGSVAVPAGVKVRRTYANEVNPVAYKYLAHNVVANKLTSKVEIFNQDTHQFLNNVFHREKPLPITQVVMTYPSATAEFLDFFVGAFDRRTWELASLPRVHLYRFSGAADPAEHFSQEVENFLGVRPKNIDVVRVAEVAPGEWMLRASFTIPAQVGFQGNVSAHA